MYEKEISFPLGSIVALREVPETILSRDGVEWWTLTCEHVVMSISSCHSFGLGGGE